MNQTQRGQKIVPLTLAFLGMAGVVLAASPAADAQNGNGRYRRNHGQNRRPIERTNTLSWSAASGQPHIEGGHATGFYIWHDRNTVHVVSSDHTGGSDTYQGTVEIQGSNGGFDTLKNQFNEGGDRFGMDGSKRITFRFDTHQAKDGFKFNLHDGDRLVFRVNRDTRKTGRIFYGSSKTEAHGDPVVFDLHR